MKLLSITSQEQVLLEHLMREIENFRIASTSEFGEYKGKFFQLNIPELFDFKKLQEKVRKCRLTPALSRTIE